MQNNTGASTFQVTLPQLPGRGGWQPDVKLQYNQFSGDGGSGFGIGWGLNLPVLQLDPESGTALRTSRSTGDFYTPPTYNGETLIFIKKEGDAFKYALKRSEAWLDFTYSKVPFTVQVLGLDGVKQTVTVPSGWRVKKADGSMQVFSGDARFAEGTGTENFVSRWALLYDINANGEAVSYEYEKAGGRSYVKAINFAGGLSRYVFETTNARGSLLSYRSSFAQRNQRLYVGLKAEYKGQLQNQWCFAYISRSLQDSRQQVVRTADACQAFASQELASKIDPDSINVLDQMRAIYRFGKTVDWTQDDNRESSIAFDYSTWTLRDLQNNQLVYQASNLDFLKSKDKRNLELSDVNHDAQVDVVFSSLNGDPVQVYQGQADTQKSFQTSRTWNLVDANGVPVANHNFVSGDFHFADINGDSLSDVVRVVQGGLEVYLADKGSTYKKLPDLVKITNLNPDSFKSGAAQFIDLDRDGMTDILVSQVGASGKTQALVYHNLSLRDYKGKPYIAFDIASTQPLPVTTTESNFFGSDKVKILDITGDELPDLIVASQQAQTHAPGLCVYENLGNLYDPRNYSSTLPHNLVFGDASLQDASCGAGRFIQLGGMNAHEFDKGIRDFWILDVNGDGIVDFASVIGTPDKIRVWLGLGNLDYMGSPQEFPLNLPIQVDEAAKYMSRIADIDGDGQSEIVIFQANGTSVIDFNRVNGRQLIKSNLMTSIQYETGLRHDIRYASSIDELERDRLLGLPLSALHFPVVLAKQVVTSHTANEQGERRHTQVEEYLYHMPDFDPVNKHFYGFAQVERIFYGDNYAQGASTQDSTYTVENYFTTADTNGDILRGAMKKQQIHGFTPHDSFVASALSSDKLAVSNPAIYSMGSDARIQSKPRAGSLKQQLDMTYQVATNQSTTNKTAYFTRTLEQVTQAFEGSDVRAERTVSLDFDSYNIPARQRTWNSALVGPKSVSVPSRLTETRNDFTAARQQLAGLGIVDKPTSTEVTLLSGDDINTTAGGERLTLVTFTYDAETGRKLSAVSRILGSNVERDRKELFTYDDFGNVIEFADELGLIQKVTYDAAGVLPVRFENALGHVSEMAYGETPAGAPTPAGFQAQTSTTKPTASRDPKGNWVFITYDDLGRAIRYQNGEGKEQNYFYKMAHDGNPSFIKTALRRYSSESEVPAGENLWIKTLKAYNPDGTELASVEENEANGVRVLKNLEHNRSKQKITEYAPYELDRTSLDAIFDAGEIPTDGRSEHAAHFFYDELGRVKKVVKHSKLSIFYGYASWGQSTRHVFETTKDGIATTSETSGSQVKRGDTVFANIDALGSVTRFDRDSWLHLKAIRLAGTATPRTLRFNSEGWLEEQNIPGVGSWTYAYDTRGRRLEEARYSTQHALVNRQTFSYDAIDRLLNTDVDGKASIRRTYDTYPAGSARPQRSDILTSPIGLMTVVDKVDPNGLYPYHEETYYDVHGRKAEHLVGVGSKSFNEKNTYTLDDVLVSYEDPFGVRVNYSLSRSMKPISTSLKAPWFTKEEDVISFMSYNQKGQLRRVDYRAGTSSLIEYDDDTLAISHLESYGKDGEKIQDLDYAFDGQGLILSIQDKLQNSRYGMVNRSAKFAYNDRGELVNTERYGQAHRYQYTEAGNMRLNTELGAQDWRTGTDQDLLPLGTAQQAFTFNSAGQMISGGNILEARYDAAGQMIYARTSKVQVYLGYSPTGIRVYRKTVVAQPAAGEAAVRESFYPMPSVVVENGKAQSFVSSGRQRLARLDHDKKEWFYYVSDHLGSSDIMLSSDGDPVEQFLYLAYGSELDPRQLSADWVSQEARVAGKKPLQPTKHRFTGHYLDDDLGIYDFGARHYNAKLGRFLSPDPLYINEPERCVGNAIDCNLYSYAMNNPLIFIDPTGFATGIPYKEMRNPTFSSGTNAILSVGSGGVGVYGTIVGSVSLGVGGAVFGVAAGIIAIRDWDIDSTNKLWAAENKLWLDKKAVGDGIFYGHVERWKNEGMVGQAGSDEYKTLTPAAAKRLNQLADKGGSAYADWVYGQQLGQRTISDSDGSNPQNRVDAGSKTFAETYNEMERIKNDPSSWETHKRPQTQAK